jgi:tetratricopeptide (TPR) repeat protein
VLADLQGELELAAGQFAAARDLYLQLGDSANAALCYSNEGYALTRLNRNQQALEAYQQCLLLYSDLGLEPELAAAHEQRGQAYESLEDWGRALADYTSAIALLQLIGDPVQQAECHHSMGRILLALENPTTARSHLEEAWRLFEAAGAEPQLGELLPVLVAALEDLGDTAAAASYRRRLDELSAAPGQSESPDGY